MLFSVFYFFLLEFFSIFQNFQYFSVFLGIFQYFSVFFSIFGTFQYFSRFSVFSVFFLVIFSIRQIKRVSCHFQQPVMMLRKPFSKKEEDYCIVKLLHEYPIVFSYLLNFRNKKYQMSVVCQLYRPSLLHELPTG